MVQECQGSKCAINEELSEKFEIPKDYSEVIRNLSQEIELKETEKAQKTLTDLQNKFRSDKYFEKRDKKDNYEKYHIIVAVFTLMITLVAVQQFVFSYPLNLTTNFSFLNNTYFIIGVFFILTFMVFISVLVLVLKFRNAKYSVLTRLNEK